MFTIFQDYKDYRKAKKIEKSIELKLINKFKEMLEITSFQEIGNYELKVGILTACAKELKNHPETFQKYLDEKAPLVYAPSCFCTFSLAVNLEPKDLIQSIALFEVAKEELDKSRYTEKKVIRCIHNPEDGVIKEHYCANCSIDKFRNLVEYHSLKGDLQQAQALTKTAKQKFLDNFSFTK